MVYKKYIKKDGKLFGPYYYESYRASDGSVKTRYVSEEPAASRRVTLFLICGLAVFLLLAGFLIASNLSSKQVSSGFSEVGSSVTGFATKFYSFITGLTADEGGDSAEGAAAPAESAPAETTEEEAKEEKKEAKDEAKEEKEESKEEGGEEGEETEEPMPEPAPEPIPEPVVNETAGQLTEPEPVANETAAPENETTAPLNETAGSEVIEIPEENITLINETGVAIENASLENVTVENITILNETANISTETSTKQYGAVLGKPVKWEKKVKVDISGEGNETLDSLTINLPSLAANVSVIKITETGEEIALNEETEEVTVVPDNAVEETEAAVVETAPITGGVIRNFFSSLFKIFASITGRVIDIAGGGTEEVVVNVQEPLQNQEQVVVEYYTSAPYAEERVLEESKSKEVKIIGPDEVHYENVLAFSELPAVVGNAANIKLYWIVDLNGTTEKQEANFSAVDGDGDALFDYIEWVVPSLSEQTYWIEIIEITKALHLDENRSLISDIYEQVREQDGIWSEQINAGEYVRTTFEQALANGNDITLYARSAGGENSSAALEVYTENGNETIATIEGISGEAEYKTYLTSLPDGESYATFDLRITGNPIEIDWIVDPTTANIPAVTSVSLATTNTATNDTNQNLTSTIAYSDADAGDNITLAYNWYRNNVLNATTMLTGLVAGNGLLSYWPFDNDTMDYWGDNNGTTSGAAATASGKVGGGWQFDGSDDYVNITSSASLNFTSINQMTVSVWFKLDTYSDGVCDWDEQSTIVEKGPFQNGLQTFSILLDKPSCVGRNSTHFNFKDLTSGTKIWAVGQTGIALGRWYHTAGTWNGSTISLYIDGILDNSTVYAGAVLSSDNCALTMGRARFDNCNGDFQAAGRGDLFDGTIDEVQIYNRSLSASEVYQLYLGGNWSGHTMHSDRTEPGDSWKLGVLAGDFLNWSAETQSNSITITGSPNTTSVTLNSSTGRDFTNDDLKCYANITDADSTNVYANYTWFQNGAEQTSLRGRSAAFTAGTLALIATLDDGNTSIGDNWTCSIMAYDELSYEAEWNNSTALKILAGCGDGSCNNAETCNDCQADCGICGGGGTGGPGQEQPCQASCACAASTCIGSTCSDGCGGACSGSLAPACPVASTIACGTAITSTNACSGCTGTGTLCSAGYICTGGVCVKAGECDSDSDCNDNNLCTDDKCGADSKCSATFNTASCNDANACTENDACSVGVCAGVQKNCDDQIACTVDSCVAGVCQHASSSCTCTKASDCDDSNVCTNDACSNGQCSASSNTASCDDANPCTIDEKCSGGICSGGTAKDCPAGKTCEPATGSCIAGEPPKEIPQDVVSVKGIFGLEKECLSDFGCDKWTECTGEYDIYDLVSGGEIKGTKTRLCIDFNNCKSNFVEKEECTFRVPVIIKTKLWCNEEYTEIRNESGSILARLKKGVGEKEASSSFLGIKLNLVGEGHCDYCYDDVQNYDETGIDCGGSCVSCELPSWPLPARMRISVLKYWVLFILSVALLVLTLAYTIQQIIIAHRAGEFARLFRKFKFWKEEGYDVEVLEPHLQQATQKL